MNRGGGYGVTYRSASNYTRMKREKANTSDKPQHTPSKNRPDEVAPASLQFFFVSASSSKLGISFTKNTKFPLI